MLKKKFYILLLIFTSILFSTSCTQKPKVIHDLSQKNFLLINQDSNAIKFPEIYKGNIVVIGFIYTACPDICPLTTNNIKLVKNELDKNNITDVKYCDISFDPDRDTPTVLKEYADVRGIDTHDFQFLTGKNNVIDTLMKNFNIYSMPGDSAIVGNDTSYFFVHTDRISIMDKDGKVRAEFQGSKASKDDIIDIINKLRD